MGRVSMVDRLRLSVVFAVSIIITTKFMPGYESYVVLSIASIVIIYTSIMSKFWNKRKPKHKSRKGME